MNQKLHKNVKLDVYNKKILEKTEIITFACRIWQLEHNNHPIGSVSKDCPSNLLEFDFPKKVRHEKPIVIQSILLVKIIDFEKVCHEIEFETLIPV